MPQIREIDNHTLQNFRNCPQLYDYRINQGLVMRDYSPRAANFGISIHCGLETYYRGGMTQDSRDAGFLAFAKEWSKTGDIEGDKRNAQKGLEILDRYFTHYSSEPFTVLDGGVEVGDAFELTPTCLYTVRIDLIVEWKHPRGIYGFDHKTSSDIGRMIAKPSNQISGYIYDLVLKFGDSVLGFQVNTLGVYQTNKTKDKETGKMVDREIFSRIPTSRTRKELDEWRDGVVQTIKLIEMCEDSNIWPRYAPEFCTAYRGRCQFLDLCLAQSEETRKRIIELKFEHKPWHAYKEAGETED